MLTPALVSYEAELTTQPSSSLPSAGSEDFAEALKHYVPQHHSFKGYPMVSQHRSTGRVLAAMLKNDVCSDILAVAGDTVRFGLRCRIFAYPDDICAVWVMLAVRFQQGS